MAWNFVRASTQQLQANGINASPWPLTLAAWFAASSTGAPMGIVSVGSLGAQTPSQQLALSGSGAVLARSRTGLTSSDASSGSALDDGYWTHGAAVFHAQNIRQAWANAVSGSIQTTSRSMTALAAVHIGARILTLDNFNGDIAEVGVWNVALTADEIASLADGMSCDKVRPQSLVFYAPLVRDLVDVKRGLTIINNNTATVAANHPRVYA